VGKIKWSQEAFDWLKEIQTYIAKDKPQVAQNIAKQIIQKVSLLQDFPEMGYRLNNFPKKNIRVVLYGHYRIIYQINQDKDINVLGIFHGALNLRKHFDSR